MALISDFTVNQDPNDSNSIFSVLGVHNEYLNHYKRWQFLFRSYLGGYEYRLGQYLTKYVYESDNEYVKRLAATPLENHVKAITHIYNSYLFRNEPKRNFANLSNYPEMDMIMEDADLEGRTFDSFMRDVNIMSTVYGHCLVMVEKPKSNARTRAQELEQGIRPYLNVYTPPNILDWRFARQESGLYELEYLKLVEVESTTYGEAETYYIREYTKDIIRLYAYIPDKKEDTQLIEELPNELGKIPAVWVYANRSPSRGIGVSDVGDVADMSNSIYNDLSELDQLIRLSNHPSLVKTPEVEAAAGAGAIVTIPNEMDPGLKPYMLQPSGQSIEGILNSINTKVEMIDRMSHMGAIRSIKTRQTSGISQIAEFQLLDTRLSEKARNLELAEEQMWRLIANWLETDFMGTIKYPRAFHLKDKSLDIDTLKKASDANPQNPAVRQYIDRKIVEALAKDDDELHEEMERLNTHPEVIAPNQMVQHMREMIQSGMSDQEILEKHPELSRLFNQQDT
jgi:hypothetical protein